ncbi:MAG: glycosyltransferase [Saprospiraceae bacterium]
MRILYPIGSLYPSQQGGPSNTVYWMAEALTRSGQDITVISTNVLLPANIDRDRWLQTSFGRVRYCTVSKPKWSLPVIYHSFREWHKIDIVHLNSLYHFPAFFLANWGVLTQKKVFWSVRGNLMTAALAHKSASKSVIHSWIKRFLLNRVTFHSTSPQESESILREISPKANIVEIGNGMKIPVQKKRNNKTGILYLGRIHEIKALDNLLQGYALLPQDIQSRFPLWIAGAGKAEYLRQLKDLAANLKIDDNVQWLGVITGDEKEQVLADAHILILPSHSENFGNVIIESLAQGTPVIASKGTPWSILETENIGYWVNNDPQSLGTAILALLNINESMYSSMRLRARNFVLNNFDIEMQIPFWTDKYQTNK